MTENYIKPEDVSPQDAQKVLNFLNSAQSAAEIDKTVEIRDERDVGLRVGQRILDRRKVLGQFSTLQQIADIPYVGPERFTEIVTTLRESQEGGDVTMYKMIEIKEYFYKLCPSKDRAFPEIWLFDTNDEVIAYVHFLTSSPLPESLQLPTGQYRFYYNRDSLIEVIDMLRNEKPVYLYWNGPYDASLRTNREPVGEEEGL